MPHIIIEYTQDTLTKEMASQLVKDCFHAVKESRLFKTPNIKVRAIPIQHYQMGIDQPGFIHICCHIHPGRSEMNKQSLTHRILNALKEGYPVAVITVETTETDRNSYAKWLAND